MSVLGECNSIKLSGFRKKFSKEPSTGESCLRTTNLLVDFPFKTVPSHDAEEAFFVQGGLASSERKEKKIYIFLGREISSALI